MSEVRQMLPPEVNEVAGQVLNQLYALMRLISLYELNNEVFEQPLQQFQELQEKLLHLEGKGEFRFLENEAFLNLTRIRLTPDIKSMVFNLLHEFKEQAVGGFALVGVLTPPVTKKFLAALSEYLRSNQQDYEGLNDALKERLISEIYFYPYQEYTAKRPQKDRSCSFQHLPLLKTYAQLLHYVGTLVAIPPGSNPAAFFDAFRKAQRNLQRLVDYAQDHPREVLALHLVQHAADPWVQQAVNMAILSISLGQFLELRKVELGDLGLCGLFYNRPRWHRDSESLNKGWGPYLHVMDMASDGGLNVSICRRLLTGFHWQLKADGSGQTPCLEKPVIPDLYTRIVAISANYENLITPQHLGTGGAGLTPHNALKFMFFENRGGLDPSLLKMFLNLMGIYPIGTLVYLNNGELAMVQNVPRNPKKIHSPRVKILRNAQGQAISSEIIDLENDPRMIQRTVPQAGVDINTPHFLFTEPVS